MINITIDNQNISVPEGITILEAAKKAGIDIPTLCFLKDINEIGDCRMCVVKVEGRRQKRFCYFLYSKSRRWHGY